MVVDDAIVVLENIFRHRESGLDPDPVSAAVNGSNEVVFAVMAATLSLVCIFAPVAFISGIIGQFFRSFALVVTFGVLVSLFVSLTLTPMLCALSQGGEAARPDLPLLRPRLRRMDAPVYLLEAALTHRLWVLLATLAVVGLGALLLRQRGEGLRAGAGRGRFLVSLRTPLGSSIDYTDSKLKEVEAILDRHPEVRSEFALIGLGTAVGRTRARWWCAWPRGRNAASGSRTSSRCCARSSPRSPARAFAAPYPMVQGQRGRAAAVRAHRREPAGARRRRGRCRRSSPRCPASAAWTPTCSSTFPADLRAGPPAHRRRRAHHPGRGAGHQHAHRRVDIAKYNDEPGDGQRYDIRVKAKEGTFTPAGRSFEDLPAQQGRRAGAPG